MLGRGPERDTDADWRELGATQPYWGVLTHPDYRTENLTPQNLEAFYASGQAYIGDIVGRLQHATGARPSGPALDFGCGVGRLAEAMTGHVADVTGYDIAPGMLEKARERGGRATYVGEFPDGPFDWINSFIVFQHIPTERGMALLEALMDRLGPGGFVSLHLTIWRDDALIPPAPRGWRRAAGPLLGLWRNARLSRGAISMYDYDLSAVCKVLNQHGVQEMSLLSTDHGGHHGVLILGRRTDA